MNRTTTKRKRTWAGPGTGTRLDNSQKAALCILAREAFGVVHGREPFSAAELAEWRHEETHKACGKDSLRTVSQRDYLAIRGHFRGLAGDAGRAVDDHIAHSTQGHRIALAKLRAELSAKSLPEAYADSIARTQFGCRAAECSERQTWNLVFTIRNRKARPAARPAPEYDERDIPF